MAWSVNSVHAILSPTSTRLPQATREWNPWPSAPHSFPSISVKEEQRWYTGLGSHLGYNLTIYFAKIKWRERKGSNWPSKFYPSFQRELLILVYKKGLRTVEEKITLHPMAKLNLCPLQLKFNSIHTRWPLLKLANSHTDQHRCQNVISYFCDFHFRPTVRTIRY